MTWLEIVLSVLLGLTIIACIALGRVADLALSVFSRRPPE